jgi:RimJ/RimL family protein N-acetyltransferase
VEDCALVGRYLEFVKLKVRQVEQNDLMLLFDWVNDPLTREMDFNPEPIPLEIHKEWFRRLPESGKYQIIVDGLQQDKWIPVGQVRVNDDGRISMSIDPQFREQRLAAPVIEAAIAYIRENTDIRVLIADIRQENTRSAKAFQRAGFPYVDSRNVKGRVWNKYTYVMS